MSASLGLEIRQYCPPTGTYLADIAPKVVSIAWLEKARSDNLYDMARIAVYMRWLLSRLNANKYFLPFTRLELRHEILNSSTSSAEFTAACERVRQEAEAEGKPVVGFISEGTSRTKNVLNMASPLPTVAYASTQAIMGNAKLYPWLVRMYPSDSQRVDATTHLMRNYKWTKVFQLVDGSSTWSRSLAKGITDESAAHGIKVESWSTPHLRDMGRLNATQADLAAAAKHARASGFKVILLAMSIYVELAIRALLDEGLFGKGFVIISA